MRARPAFILLSLVSLGAFLSGVLLSKYMFLAACPLCILQRMLYLLFGTFGLMGIAAANSRLGSKLVALLMAVAAGTGAFIAAYQSWIQHHPEGPSCTANTPWWENLVYWAGQQWPDLFLSSGMCTDPGFVLFGLSIAEYSLILFTLMTLVCLALLFRKRTR